MDLSIIMAAIGAIAVSNCLFFGVYLLFNSGKNKIANRFLSFLLFALAIRIGKSIAALMFPEMSAVLTSVGVVAMAMIGPSLWFYVLALLRRGTQLKTISIHFALPTLLGISVGFVGFEEVYLYYQLTIIQFGVYLIATFIMLRKANVNSPWLNQLLAGSLLLWLVFFVQIIAESRLYYVISVSAAVLVLYWLSYLGMRSARRILKGNLITNGNDRLPQSLRSEIEAKIRERKLYLEPDLTTAKLAQHLGVQAYLISKAVNEEIGKTLPEWINELRIEEACQKLESQTMAHFSIEAIAHDSGFNSLSSFYSAFKRLKGTTPAHFRDSRFLNQED